MRGKTPRISSISALSYSMICTPDFQSQTLSALAVSDAVVWNCLPTGLRVVSLTVATLAKYIKGYLFSCREQHI